MCGIAGFTAPDPEVRDVLRAMNRALAHRGPDGSGVFVDSHVALGHTRLAIIDLAGGAQPRVDQATGDALVFSFKTSAGQTINYSTPTGQSYEAKIDGKEAPYRGDPGTTSVSLKRIGNSLVETDYRNGKVISVALMSVSADGKTLTIDVDDKLNGTKATYTAEKQ